MTNQNRIKRVVRIPELTPVYRDLSVEDKIQLIDMAERAYQRRAALRAQMKEALAADDVPRLKGLAREFCGMGDDD